MYTLGSCTAPSLEQLSKSSAKIEDDSDKRSVLCVFSCV